MPDRATLLGPQFIEIPAPQGERTEALVALWRDLKPADDLPNRDDFTFERIHRLGLLGHFFVIEPLEDGRDWRYRLLGTQITWLFGRDVTNVPFSAHFDAEEAEQCIALSNRVSASRAPLYLMARFVTGDYAGQLETLSLPVWNPRRDAIWLIGASLPTIDAA